MKIEFNMRHIADKEKEYIEDSLQQESVAHGGKYYYLCKEYLRNYYLCEDVVITSNGFSAAYIAMLLEDIGPGDSVLISVYSCPSVMNGVLLCGATPILCGIDESGCVTAESLLKAMQSNTKAVIVNHHGGHACDVERIFRFCEEYKLCFIEDCATAHGSIYKGKKLGTFGNFAILSFNDKKDISAGEGGALIINDSMYHNRMYRANNGIQRVMTESGVTRPVWKGCGFSNKISEVQSALIYAQLVETDYIVSIKRYLYSLYADNLRNLEKMLFFKIGTGAPEEIPNGNTFFLVFRNKEERDALREFLKTYEIDTLAHYGSLGQVGEWDKRIVFDKEFDSMEFDARMLRLPIYTSLKKENVEYICERIQNYYIGEKNG